MAPSCALAVVYGWLYWCIMGHINMVTSAFVASLSEDVGERSGLALSKQQLVEHLREDNPLRIAFTRDDELLRIGSGVYEDNVGDLMHALGAAEEPGMPTLGVRLIKRLGPDWRSRMGMMELLKVEAVANHHIQRRNETGTLDRNALDADVENSIGRRRVAIMDDLLDAMSVHLAQSPFFTRYVQRAEDPVTLTSLFESEHLPTADLASSINVLRTICRRDPSYFRRLTGANSRGSPRNGSRGAATRSNSEPVATMVAWTCVLGTRAPSLTSRPS
jgi:hypothetical protein